MRFLSETTTEAYGLGELPGDWQDVLGVRTGQELRRSVGDYQDALDVSQRLVEEYRVEVD